MSRELASLVLLDADVPLHLLDAPLETQQLLLHGVALRVECSDLLVQPLPFTPLLVAASVHLVSYST